MKPLVSLCMSAYNRPQLFPESLAGLLNQEYEPLEIIVLVDGGQPETIRMLEECGDPRLQWFATGTSKGMVPAWNTVCARARGKYLLFCADDDIMLPRAIDEQVKMLENDSSLLFCHADWLVIDDDGKQIGAAISPRGTYVESGASAWGRFIVVTGTAMQTAVVRTAAWRDVGGWDENAGNPADNSLYLKLLRRGNVGHVGKVVGKYRARVRQPDSWDRLFRNLREDHSLGMRHLTDPPPGAVARLPQIRRRFLNRLAATGLHLERTAPSPAAARELARWLGEHVWQHTTFGRLCARANRSGGSNLLAMLVGARNSLRQRAKLVAAHLQRARSGSLPDIGRASARN